VVTEAVRAGRRRAPTYGLVQLDVTDARRRLAGLDPPGSFTAFVVASVARAAARHPEVHGYLDWRRRLVVHRHVDVVVMVEVEGPGGGSFPLAHVLRDADLRGVVDLTAELREVSADPDVSPTGRMLRRRSKMLGRIPGATRLMYRLMERSVWVRSLTGTVAVTSVGMFGGGGGFGIGFPTIPTLGVLVGGIAERPWMAQGAVVPRQIVDLTVMVDHKIVDGAPAARFGADLRRIVESASVLD
jgi:pyruvate/2-oxoglutarate dehydrogenase complex dihydrolipoamide acyltransferase (E2) component